MERNPQIKLELQKTIKELGYKVELEQDGSGNHFEPYCIYTADHSKECKLMPVNTAKGLCYAFNPAFLNETYKNLDYNEKMRALYDLNEETEIKMDADPQWNKITLILDRNDIGHKEFLESFTSTAPFQVQKVFERCQPNSSNTFFQISDLHQ